MKQIKLFLSCSFTACLIFFTSCSSNEDSVINNSESENVKVTKSNGLDINDFEVDSRLNQIDSISKILSSISFVNDRTEYMIHYPKLHNLAHEIVVDYGYNNAINYATTLASNSASGACCELTEDNTIDMSCCNFFEHILVALRSIGCEEPSSLDYEEAIEQAEAYYNCVQDVICRTC